MTVVVFFFEEKIFKTNKSNQFRIDFGFEMNNLTKIPQWCLKTIGIKFTNMSEIKSKSQKFSSFLVVFYMGLAFLGILNSCYIHRHDMVLFLESLGFVCTNLQTISKGVTILIRRKELFLLHEKIVELFSKGIYCFFILQREVYLFIYFWIFFNLCYFYGVFMRITL